MSEIERKKERKMPERNFHLLKALVKRSFTCALKIQPINVDGPVAPDYSVWQLFHSDYYYYIFIHYVQFRINID